MQEKGEFMRLDKLLARLGLGSRREVQQIIRGGRVQVEGIVQKNPGLVLDPALQGVTVDGQPCRYERWLYLMLHKPAGLVTALEDKRLPTVGALLSERDRAMGVVPVGRLDRDTTGLLLLTNDGDLHHRLLSPKRHVEKTYRVTVDIPLTALDVEMFQAGLALSDFTAKPAKLVIVEEREGLLTLTEGKYHQVKRMMAARGKEVLTLHRERFGPLLLDPALNPGEIRPLTPEETQALREAAGKGATHG